MSRGPKGERGPANVNACAEQARPPAGFETTKATGTFGLRRVSSIGSRLCAGRARATATLSCGSRGVARSAP